jgi:hypothetical protein
MSLMYIILMDTHKGQTKYCITLNDEDSNIVKITRAKPGTIPGRWHTEEEVKLDSTSQDVYGTSKQNVEKMFQEIAESKIDATGEEADDKEESADEKADDKEESADEKADGKEESADEKADGKEESADEKADGKEESADEKADDKEVNIIENDMKADSKDAAGAGNEDDEKEKMMKDRAAHSKALTDAIAARRQQIGEGRKTRKHNKRTTRKKNRKGPHSKSNKNKRKHTRGKK